MQDDDLPATKGDVRAVKADVDVLKTDVQGLKTDVSNIRQEMATKTELKDFEDRVGIVFCRYQGQIEHTIEGLRADMDAGFSRVTGTVDSFIHKLETYGLESAGAPHTFDEHGKKLRDHEARISTLESRGAPPPAGTGPGPV